MSLWHRGYVRGVEEYKDSYLVEYLEKLYLNGKVI